MSESIRLVSEPLSLFELQKLAEDGFGDFVKAVVDVDQRVMVVGGELHADEEQYLLERGSQQGNLWGINLYPAQFGTDEWVEFDSMINLRPSAGNRSRGVENPATKNLIVEIVNELVRSDG
ncbi:MAG: DUF5674 family protein [Dehalococcoidia bacterium]